MGTSLVMEIMQHTMVVVLKVSTPILVISMLVGLIIAIFQAATQIHEQTLTFVPKLLATGLILVFSGAWMIEMISDFIYYIFDMMTKIN